MCKMQILTEEQCSSTFGITCSKVRVHNDRSFMHGGVEPLLVNTKCSHCTEPQIYPPESRGPPGRAGKLSSPSYLLEKFKWFSKCGRFDAILSSGHFSTHQKFHFQPKPRPIEGVTCSRLTSRRLSLAVGLPLYSLHISLSSCILIGIAQRPFVTRGKRHFSSHKFIRTLYCELLDSGTYVAPNKLTRPHKKLHTDYTEQKCAGCLTY
jgi:hypothetical protein